MRTLDRRTHAAARGAALAAGLATVLALAAPVAGATSSSTPDTAAALRKATWASNVKTSFADGTFRYRSDGVPETGVLDEYAVPNPGVVVPNETNSHVSPRSQVVKEQHYDFTITTRPRKAKRTTSVFTGPVGMTIN